MIQTFKQSTSMDRPETRFLSKEECAALAKRIASFAVGGGNTKLIIESTWTGNLRYARNTITTSGDVRDNEVSVLRDIRGAYGLMLLNQIDDTGIEAAVRRSEHLLKQRIETGGVEFQEHYIRPPDELRTFDEVLSFQRVAAFAAGRTASLMQEPEPHTNPHIFFDTTYTLDAKHRAAALEPLIAPIKASGMFAAGYIQVSAHGRAVIDTWGRSLYYPYTKAQFSVTVRDPKGTGSGWAGVDFSNWARIDTKKLSEIALDKCLRSRNPVAVEPGRHTAILEPQAVCDLFQFIIPNLDRDVAERGNGPFAGEKGTARFGKVVLDQRITVSADPMDPDLGFPPFDRNGNVYHPVKWIEEGVLKELAYYRPYGIKFLGKNSGLPNSHAFRVSGGTATIDDMIASTKRGFLVTRFSDLRVMELRSLMVSGYTRDGLWLIENGKISKPVKNFRITESPLFAFNNIEELGVPQRVFHPSAPAVVPAMKIRDFSFTGLSEAV